MKRILFTCLIFVFCVASVFAQKAKPWTEWSKKDAEKILNDSGWGQTQDDTDTSDMMYSPTSNNTITATSSNSNAGRDLSNRGREESGAKNTPLSLKYRVRFFSAKPVREAFARLIVLQQKTADEATLKAFATKMQGWIDVELGDIVVVAVSIEATDRRMSGPSEQAFRSATADTLKNNCYLERKDGKRLYVTMYEQPTADQTGAKFVFPRTLDGQPFLSGDNEDVRFVAEFSEKIKINRKYKVSDMMYNGKVEY